MIIMEQEKKYNIEQVFYYISELGISTDFNKPCFTNNERLVVEALGVEEPKTAYKIQGILEKNNVFLSWYAIKSILDEFTEKGFVKIRK